MHHQRNSLENMDLNQFQVRFFISIHASRRLSEFEMG